MKPLSAQVINFGSYESLEFDFSNQGLALLYGPTGAGKSTILDIVPWCIFGQTAKNGKADDVRSWTNNGPTTGTLTVDTPQGTVDITRIRDEKSNDLYYIESIDPDTKIRGKDLKETQTLINRRLGMDFDSYITASYSCSASPTETFYVANAKQRRELFEKITDLSLPTKLLERVQSAKKQTKKDQVEYSASKDKLSGKVDQIRVQIDRVARDYDLWDKSHQERIQKLQTLKDNFETEKYSKIEALKTKSNVWNSNKIDLLERLDHLIHNQEILTMKLESLKASSRCITCGGITEEQEKKVDIAQKAINLNDKRIYEQDRLIKETDPYVESLNSALELENHYEEQMANEIYAENPYDSQYKKLQEDHDKAIEEFIDRAKALNQVNGRYKALEHLQDLSSDLRAILLKTAVSQIETQTNRLLETYFDGAFRCQFIVVGDDLDVSIQKSGYECSYLQLSKGQRRLLTLCFSIAIMEASANNSGIHYDYLALDEAFDGCDSDLKTMGYGLLEDLASRHSTVLVIDHSTELKNMFDKRFEVRIVGDHSELEEEE